MTESKFDILETTIDDIHRAYASGELTCRQLVQAYLDRIAAYDKQGPALNTIITLNSQAIEEAERLDARYKTSGLTAPLHGIPVIVKDQADVKGMPTTLGSVLFKNYFPDRDSFVVERLRKASAVILGKSALGEMAGGDTYGSLFGSTRNPYDLERTVGGSSGGSAAAVTANFCAVAIGQEGLASIRRPAAWNSIAGMRTSAGLVSRGGVYSGWPSLAGSLGPMTRTIADTAAVLDVIVGYDAEDPLTAHAVGHAPASFKSFLDKDGLTGARLGILREPMGIDSEPESDDFRKVDEVFDRAVGELQLRNHDRINNFRSRALERATRQARNRSGRGRAVVQKLFRSKQKSPVQVDRRGSGVTRIRQSVAQRAEPHEGFPGSGQALPGAARARRADDESTEGDGRSSARCDRAQGRGASADLDQRRAQAALRQLQGRAAPEHVSGFCPVGGRPRRLHPRQPSGGHRLSRAPLRRWQHDQVCLRLRAGDKASSAAELYVTREDFSAKVRRKIKNSFDHEDHEGVNKRAGADSRITRTTALRSAFSS